LSSFTLKQTGDFDIEMNNAVTAGNRRLGKSPEHRDVRLRAEGWDALAPDKRPRLPANQTLEVLPRDIHGDTDAEAGNVTWRVQFGGVDVLTYLVEQCGLDPFVAGPLDFDLCLALGETFSDFLTDTITRAKAGVYRLSPAWISATEGNWFDEVIEAEQQNRRSSRARRHKACKPKKVSARR
jgi:hypothetical protein